MLMSFIGSVGSLMSGSGLVEAMDVNYGPNAVQHMITGKAIVHAIRGHFLVEAALAVNMIRSVIPTLACKSNEASTSVAVEVDHINTIARFRLNNTEVGQISMMYEGVVQGHHSIKDFLQLAVFKKFDVLLMDHKTKVCALSRTAKLWCMYMEHIKTIKWFIRMDR